MLQTFTTSDGLPNNLVRAFIQDTEGKMWVGTRCDGLGVFHNGGFRRVSFEEGLISQTVWALAYDSVDHVLWAGTSAGVQRIDASTLRPHTYGDGSFNVPTAGLGVVPGRFVWFIDEEGLHLYDQTDVRVRTAPSPVMITGVSVNGVPVDWREVNEFRDDENTMQFAFRGVTFRESKGLRYQYRLVGLDKDWHPPTQQRGMTYASLSPGSYVFEVVAINAAGISNATPASVVFSIVPPFWQRLIMLKRVRSSKLGTAKRSKTENARSPTAERPYCHHEQETEKNDFSVVNARTSDLSLPCTSRTRAPRRYCRPCSGCNNRAADYRRQRGSRRHFTGRCHRQ